MKKLKKNLYGLGLSLSLMLGVAFGLMPAKTVAQQTGFVYETEIYFKIMGGKLCSITECTGNAGTDCTSPGSKFRTCISLNPIR